MFEIKNGNCIDLMRAMPDNSVDSIVTDPPYELGFMGKSWDASGIAYDVAMWREALRVLKPGGHLLAFSGSRTFHRMACAIEDAGFEIRDQIMWVYGSGFPKSLDVSKAIDKAAGAERQVLAKGKAVKRMIPGADQNATGSWIKDNGREYVPQVTAAATPEAQQWSGWGTALKPAHEPICVARKPLVGTVAANVLAHGTGALNIDGCRVATSDSNFARPAVHSGEHEGWDRPWKHTEDGEARRQISKDAAAAKAVGMGRWPANLIHDGSDEVLAAFPDARSAGNYPSDSTTRDGVTSFGGKQGQLYADAGSAARFFYCAKASKSDRGAENVHPTVKPTDLMAYLVRLVTPPGGLVLDPFTGSGSTGKACMREGFRFVGCELSPEYAAIAQARIEHELTGGLL